MLEFKLICLFIKMNLFKLDLIDNEHEKLAATT